MHRRGLGLRRGTRLRGFGWRSGNHAVRYGSEHRTRQDRLAFIHGDMRENAVSRRVDLKRDLVGLKLGHGLVGLHGIARLLEPLANGCFGNGFPQRGDNDFDGHLPTPKVRRIVLRQHLIPKIWPEEVPAKLDVRKPFAGWRDELSESPLILSFSLWEKGPSNGPRRKF